MVNCRSLCHPRVTSRIDGLGFGFAAGAFIGYYSVCCASSGLGDSAVVPCVGVGGWGVGARG
jgi:hypothetical protein